MTTPHVRGAWAPSRAVVLAAAGVLLAGGLAACSDARSPAGAPTGAPTDPAPGVAPTPFVEAGATTPTPTARLLRRLERERLRDLVAGDVEAAAPVHAADFELVPPPGYPMTRDDYLAAVGSGELDYEVFEPISRIEVRVHGRAAVLWYESRIAIDAAGVGAFEHDTWHLYLYEKRAGRWQVVREQATAVGGFPPA